MSQRMYPGMRPEDKTSFTPYSAFDIPADLRELHGRYDVESTARRVRNFRYAEEWVMMMLGGWIATIPELPVKTGLGKVIWETAQAADEFGKRLPELRCGRKSAEASESPNEGFATFIQSVSEPERPDLTIEKLAGVFDLLMPHLLDVHEQTIRETDQICDAPTIEILEDIVRKRKRHIVWGQTTLDSLCDTQELRDRRKSRVAALQEQIEKCGGVTGTLEVDRGTLN
jgi:hypothetical protein